MRAIVFGQSGIEKDAYLDEVARVAKEQGRSFRLLNLGTRMQQIDPEKRDPELFPSLTITERTLLRRTAFTDLLRELEASSTSDCVLNAHAVFKTNTGIAAAYDVALLKEFSPDVIVVLIDDFHYVHRRLESGPFRTLSLAAILEWRDAELSHAKAIAEQLFPGMRPWPFYVVARGHNPQVLYRLLYERDNRLRIYSSFAITGADRQQRQKIEDFKGRLSLQHTVFDPLKIVERSIIAYGEALVPKLAEPLTSEGKVSERDVAEAYSVLLKSLVKAGIHQPGLTFRATFEAERILPALSEVTYSPSDRDRSVREDSVEPHLLAPYRFSLDELLTLGGTIDGQILSRDYLLIDQSDVVCALVSSTGEFQGPDVSAGSQSEITYAKSKGRRRLIVFEGNHKKLSPWITENASQMFRSLEDLEVTLAGYDASSYPL